MSNVVASLLSSERRALCAPGETLALCSAQSETLATLAQAVALGSDGKPPRWVKLLPFGKITPNDGRQPWTLPAENADAVIAASKTPGLIDFDHGTQTKNDSRASGWAVALAKANPETGEPGLWAQIDWTDPGSAALAAKTYRFFSPTFLHNAARVVTRIVGGSLVNNPALVELPALASTQQENVLDPAMLAKLRQMLGLPDTATPDDITNAIQAMCSQRTATAAHMTAICAAADIAYDPAKFGDTEQTALCTKLRTPASGQGATTIATMQTTIDELQKTVATLSQTQTLSAASAAVDKAITDGAITPAQREWATGYATRDPEGFTAFCASAPRLAAGRRAPAVVPAEGALDEDEIALCAQLGIKHEDFAATKKARKEAE